MADAVPTPEDAADEPMRRLATYGPLGPDREHHHELDALGGRWSHGSVRGHLVHEGWGSAIGYPGIRLDPDGDEVAVHLFESDDLPGSWARLDGLEGPEYRRVVTTVRTSGGDLEACIYELAPRGTDAPER